MRSPPVVEQVEQLPASLLEKRLGAIGLLRDGSVTDNIPLAAMLSKILSAPEFGVPGDSPLWWSVIFGANLGGNLTPIGSASTLVAVTIMHKHEVGISFVRFVVLAFPYAIMHITLAVAYVLIFLA